MIEFDLPKEKSSIIKVIGVGGGGNNAVNHMYNTGIIGVNFMVCNTDRQALENSPVPNKIQLGASSDGLGAGADPDVGKQATVESMNEIKEFLEVNTKMLFITAGMGGGTGTGGAPVIAKLAQEMDILTVGIVTTPFTLEGRRRHEQAIKGMQELKDNVDSLIVIGNDKLRDIYGNLPFSEAFAKADDVLAIASKGIAEIITVPMHINVDFKDVRTVMKDGGVAIMGTYTCEGEDRALKAAQGAMDSPLLNDSNIKGADYILLTIMSGNEEVLMDEIDEIMSYVQDMAGNNAEVIMGAGSDTALGNKISVTVIATGFEKGPKHVHRLEEEPRVTQLTEEEPAVVEQESSDDSEFTLFSRSSLEEPQSSFIEKKMESKSQAPQDDLSDNQLNNELLRLQQERIRRLKSYKSKWETPSGLNELEAQPAYQRKEIDFTNAPHSSEEQLSKYTLNEPENGQDPDSGLKDNNKFFYNNVD